MANNIAITSGSGPVVATDDVGGVHYQVFKLAGGTEDGAERIPGTTASGLLVNTELPAAAALADAAANPTVPLVGAPALLFNGTTWDRARGNEELQVLASAARTATTASSMFTNRNARGIIVELNVTAASGTGGLTLHIQERLSVVIASAVNVAPTAITTTGIRYFVVYPGATETNKNAAIAQVVSQPLSRQWRILVLHGDASSYTYEVNACLIV